MQLSKKVDDFLKRTQVCVLATTGPGQAPHAIPIWYRYRDGKIIITTSGASREEQERRAHGQGDGGVRQTLLICIQN